MRHALAVLCLISTPVMAAGTDWQDAPLPEEKGNDL